MFQIVAMTVRDSQIAQAKIAKMTNNIGRSGVNRLHTEPSRRVRRGIDIVLSSDKFVSEQEFMNNLIQELVARLPSLGVKEGGKNKTKHIPVLYATPSLLGNGKLLF